MTPVAAYNRKHVAILAEQGLSQKEIADKLKIATSTVHRIKHELGLTLGRKKNEYGPRHEIYRQARKDLQEARQSVHDNADGAVDGEEAQFATEITGADLARRFDEIRNSRSPEARLKANLQFATTKHERYEITYGHVLMEFEKLQHKLGKRGPLPPKERKEPRVSTASSPTPISKPSPSARVLAAKRKEYGAKQGLKLLKLMPSHDGYTAAELAPLIDESVQRVSNYLDRLFNEGSLYRERMLVTIKDKPKRQWRWVYSKSPIETDYQWD